MTGVEINLIYEQQIGQTYSGIEDLAKKNRRFAKALLNGIEGKYRSLNEQREFDELRSVIKTDIPFIPGSNQIPIESNNISHVLAIKARYTSQLNNLVIKNFTETTPVVMELFSTSNLRTGELISVAGASGIIIDNSRLYVKALNRFRFALYYDKQLTDPCIPDGAYVTTSSPVIKRVISNYCQMIKSDEKISSIGSATKEYPRYEIQDGSIKIYPFDPADAVCEQADIDYIKSDAQPIDLSSTTDYSTWYSDKFIYHVIDLASKDFDLSFRDFASAQAQDQQIMINP